ncbi:MAG TPA: cache domain-containing protein [Candidatus Nanoarchaeia archaeon]|nr:cache domain-containing protein [Candidatus Nanoarchaeia archaeon]
MNLKILIPIILLILIVFPILSFEIKDKSFFYSLEHEDEMQLNSIVNEKSIELTSFFKEQEDYLKLVFSEEIFQNLLGEKTRGNITEETLNLAEKRILYLNSNQKISLGLFDENWKGILVIDTPRGIVQANLGDKMRFDNKTSFFFHYNKYTNNYFFVTMFNVFKNDELLGYFGSKVEESVIEQKFFNKPLNEGIEIYLLDSDGFILQKKSSNSGDYVISVQKVDDSNFFNCFSQKNNWIIHNSTPYLNYNGKLVIASYIYLQDFNWCLFATKSVESTKHGMIYYFEQKFFFILLMILIFSFFNLGLYFYFKKFFKIDNLTSIVSISVFFSLVIILCYFYLSFSKFEGLNFKFLIPTLISILFLFVLFVFSLKINYENKIKCSEYFVFGFYFFILVRLMSIFVRLYYQKIGTVVNVDAGILILIFAIFSYLFIFKGFIGGKNK